MRSSSAALVSLQARENLKKIRAIIRRIQNRGYATLARIVTHLDRLAVGDEANAVIDATDAVSLMTVHAAKGLEFPGRLRRQPVARHGEPAGADSNRDGETTSDVSVAVGDFRVAAPTKTSRTGSARRPSGCCTWR